MGVALLTVQLHPSEENNIKQLQAAIDLPGDKFLHLKTSVGLNKNRVSAWNEIIHANKVSSHLPGKQGRKYFILMD